MNPRILVAQDQFGIKSWRSCLRLLIAIAILCGGSLARAQFQTETWKGSATGTITWTNATAWTPQVVGTKGDALIFGPAITNVPQNNFTNLGIFSITFTTNSYALGGSALQITNGITDNSTSTANPLNGGGNSISIPLTLGKAQTFANNSQVIGTNANYFTNTISGSVDLKTNTLTIGGGSPIFLTGAISSTNGGNLIIINPGITRLAASNSFGINRVVITSGITNGFAIVTNFTYYTNVYVVAGVSTNYTYFTNSVVGTNGTVSFGTNVFGPLNSESVWVQQGTLQLNNISSIPNAIGTAGAGNLKLDGTLDLNGINPLLNGLDDSGSFSGIVDNLNPANTGLYNLTLGLGNSNGVFSGTIGIFNPDNPGATVGTIGLIKTGFGTQTLLNANQYSGPTVISQGKLVVGSGGTLGEASVNLNIASGAVLDVSGLNPSGYLPIGGLTINAGTPTKPYTNFLGSFDPYYGTSPANYVVTITGTNNVLTFATNTDLATFTNVVVTTNFASLSYSTNSIVNIVNADVVGNFTVNGGGAISPVTSLSPFVATWAIQGNLTLDQSVTPKLNRVNMLLGPTTTLGGGINDLIAVSGTLKIGGELDFLVTPTSGSLAAGTYTLITSANYVPVGTPNLVVITSRGLFGDTVQAAGNNITLTSIGGTATPGLITWRGTPTLNNWDVHLSQNWVFQGTNDFFYPNDNAVFDDTGVGTIVLPVVVAPGSMTFNNNRTNYTFAASIDTFVTGPGGLVKNGSGTVTLQNLNSFTGDVTVNAGTLAIGYSGTGYGSSGLGQYILYNGTAAGNLILGGGTINQNSQNDSQTLPVFNNLTVNAGASTISQSGRGANELPAFNISNNVTRVVGGVLNLITSGRAGSHAGIYFTSTNSPDGTADYGVNGILGGWAMFNLTDWVYANRANTDAQGGNMGLPAARYQPDTNPANWGATSNVLINADVTGSANTAMINSLKINTSGSYTLNINPGQTLTIASGGILVPVSAGQYFDAINGGTLLGDPSDDLVILNNNIVGASTLTIGSVIADNGGPSGLTSAGSGTTVLAGNNTYTGPTYIDNGFNGAAPGTLQVGANGTSGDISHSSAVIDNGVLAFNRSDNTSVNGAISGTGGLKKLSGGALTLTANNSLSGLVTISAGTLQLGNGGTGGSVSNAAGIVDNATLVFDNSSTVGYPGVISGYGNLVQFGSGNLIVSTNHTYSGFTIISNGTVTLTATGYLTNTAAIVVKSGATLDVSALSGGNLTLRGAAPSEILAGSGTVNGSVTTAAGTTVSPGTNGVIGTLTINNNLTLNGGTFVFDVGNGNGNGDRINVNGNIVEGSGLIAINVVGGPLNNGVYPLIHVAGGIPSGAVTNLGLSGFIQSGQIAQLINEPLGNNLDLLVSGGDIASLTWVGDGSGNVWDINSHANWNNGSGAVVYANPEYTTFDDTGSVSPAVNIAAAVSPNGVTNIAVANNYTLGVPGGGGKISGGAKLVQNGASLLTLQALNDYAGGTEINAGVVQLGNNTAANADGMVGPGSVNIAASGALVVSNFATEILSGSLSGSGQLVQDGVGKLVLAGNNSAFSGGIWATNFLQMGNGVSGTLGTGPVTNNRTLLFNVGPTPVSAVTVSANITGSGGVTNIGPGVVMLTGNNTYAGSTVIPEGTIQLGSDTALPPNTALIMDDNNSPGLVGTLDLNGHDATVGSLQGSSTGQGNSTLLECTIVNDGVGASTNTLTIGGGAATTFSGQILDNNNGGTGKVALLVTNNSYLTLNACYNNVTVNTFPNLFTGGITVSNAALILGVNTGTPPSNEGGAANGTGRITLMGGHGTITNGAVGLPTNGVLYACDNGQYSGTSTGPTISTQIGEVNVPAGEFGSIFGPSRGQFACTLTGSGTVTYQPNYVRSRLGGDWSGFTGTIIFQGLFAANNGGGGFGIDQANGFGNASLYMGLNNVNQCQISGTIGGHVFPIGALSGGDSSSIIGGGSTANGTSNGAANTIWAFGSLGLTTTNGSQITDGGCGIRVVGGSLTLTNTTLSYGGQTVVSNATLALAPLGLTTNIASINGTPGDPAAITNFIPINYLTNTTYLVTTTNFTVVGSGILDFSQVGDNTFRLGHTGGRTLFGNGTINGNLEVTNSVVAPGRRASDTGIYPGNLKVTGTAAINFGSTLQMAVRGDSAPAYDSLTAAGGLTINSARLTVNTNGAAFANGSSNVFRFFSSAVPANAIGGAGTVGITNITVPDVANSYWVTNLTLDGSMALVNTNAAVVVNPSRPPVQVTVNGNQLTLGWPTNLGWILQAQTNSAAIGLSNNWVDVPGSAAQTNAVITINPSSPSVFYRLRSPP